MGRERDRNVPDQGRIPDNPLTFIKRCIRRNKIFWTYHVNMRLGQRALSRDIILGAVDFYEAIEEYPKDKYLPSYLIRADNGELVFHVQIATDTVLENIRIVTAYVPDPSQWGGDFRKRRSKQ